MIKPGGNFFKNLKVCLKTSQANIPNRAYVKYCCVVKNLTFLRNMCITSLSSMLCRPSYVKPKDCSTMNKINLIDKIMLPPQSEFPKIPNLICFFVFFSFFTLYPNLYALSLVGNTLLCKCASYTPVASHVWLYELSLYILTRLLTRAIVWLCLFICLLYLYLSFVFVLCICLCLCLVRPLFLLSFQFHVDHHHLSLR